MTTFRGMISFRHVISEGKSFLYILLEFIHLVGAIDFRPWAGGGKPRGDTGGGSVWGGTENVPFLSTLQSHISVPHPLRTKKEKRFITIRNLDQSIPRREWMKPAVLNEEHKSSSVLSLCES